MRRILKLVPTCLFPFLSLTLVAEEVDTILERHYEARGGLERLRAVESMVIEGHNRFQEQEIAVRYLAKRPNLLRMESASSAIQVIRVFDGERAWQAMRPAGGEKQVAEMEGQEAVELIRESDFDGPLIDYREKGHEIRYGGREFLGEREVLVLEVTEQGGAREVYHFDPETYHIAMKAAEVPAEGGTIRFEMYYDDFRETDGLVLPFRTTAVSDGQTVFTGVIERVEGNVDLDPDLFTRP